MSNDGLVPDASNKAVSVSDDVVSTISDIAIGTATATVVAAVNVHSVTIAIAIAMEVVTRRYGITAGGGSDSMTITLRGRPSSQSSPIPPCCFGCIPSGLSSCCLTGGTSTCCRCSTPSSSMSTGCRGTCSSSA